MCFDDFWYEEMFRVSLPEMRLHALWDKTCTKPFVCIGYDVRTMTFENFKKKIRQLKVSFCWVTTFVQYQIHGPKFEPTNSPFPDTIIDVGGRFTKGLIFECGWTFLTPDENGPKTIGAKPVFTKQTGKYLFRTIILFYLGRKLKKIEVDEEPFFTAEE